MRVPIGDRVRRWLDPARIDLDLAKEIKADNDVRVRAPSLDNFCILTRYPDALAFADAALAYQRRGADDALASARSVFAWCERTIAVARAADPDWP